jgi:hypothetical protein
MTLQRWNAPVAERLCDELEALATEVNSLTSQAFAMTARAAILGATGEFEAALAAIAEARDLAERIPAADAGWDPSFHSLVDELTTMHLSFAVGVRHPSTSDASSSSSATERGSKESSVRA